MHWLNRFRSLFSGTKRRPPARVRLGAERLEDRAVPCAYFEGYTFGTGALPQLIATGDFNNDWAPDLAVSNQNGTLSVLLGDFTGWNYQTLPLRSLPGINPEGITAGDFNRDGNLDLAIANYGFDAATGSVTQLLGNGDGSFRNGPSVFVPFGAGPTYVAAGDLDWDTDLDLVVSDFNRNQMLVYQGDGGGNFALLHSVTGNGLSNPNQALLVDLDADGDRDLAVANKGNGTASVFYGNGWGFFDPAQNIATGPESIGMAAGDFDGDGRTDLAVANYGEGDDGSTLSVLRNVGENGGIWFEDAVNFSVGRRLINVAAADYDGDGRIDLAVSSAGDDRVYVLQNESETGWLQFGCTQSYAVGDNPVGLVAADMNLDGLIDLAVTNEQSHSVTVLMNWS